MPFDYMNPGVGPAVARTRHGRAPRRLPAVLLILLACSGDPSGPASVEVSLLAADGDAQFAAPGQTTELPLTVRAIDAARGTGVKDVTITWTATGTGATVSPTSGKTDGAGFLSVTARLGTDTGTYRFEATTSKLVGSPARFTIRAVPTPTITSATPLPAQAGAAVTITGTGFSPVASENSVLFGGFRGVVQSSSPTSIVATVPECVTTRTTDLRVALGAVISAPLPVQTSAGTISPVSLAPGQVLRLSQPTDFDCVRFGSLPAGARFLVVPQNAVRAFDVAMRYEFTANATGVIAQPAESPAATPHTDAAIRFETMIRLRERAFGPAAVPGTETSAASREITIPAVGERREFNVLTRSGGTTTATGVVRLVSSRAIIYVDVNAPSPGLTDADLAGFASLFDDPIYTTDTSVYGTPSDIDDNQRVVIFFTGAVNALTERTDPGLIGGYFYGCDLVEKNRCSATNRGEIFYSLLPDPTGQYSAPRSKDVVLHTVPSVLAHEFQHMINFNRKGGRLDVLWLSEALAHSAEDIVGDVFAARGDAQTANDFRKQNYTRAYFYLLNPGAASLLAEESPGTLEQRGGSWLLLKYAMMHYGGNALLGALTSSNSIGADNLSAATGRAWDTLLSDFGTAIWADRSPQLSGLGVDPVYGFGAFDMRAAVTTGGVFPLSPQPIAFQNFLRTGAIQPGTAEYLMFEAPSAQAGFNFAFTGRRGGSFATGVPQLTIMRVR